MLVLLGEKVSKCYGFIIPFKLCAGPFFSKSCAASLLHSNVISFSKSHNFIARLRFLFVFSVF